MSILKAESKYKINDRNQADGLLLLKDITDGSVADCFFDPQYRGVLDKLHYGNEGQNRGQERASLTQMTEETIVAFIQEINRVLRPSGYMFLWVDKYHLCTGVNSWLAGTDLQIVDMITWNKGKIGMGYRTRRQSEYLIVIQKAPIRAKGTWKDHSIPDVWQEKISGKIHPHEKPHALQRRLIEATTEEGDFILDPCAGSFEIMSICFDTWRNFIGGDIAG